jgi:tetratricopeptide (TPR) repeat protein
MRKLLLVNLLLALLLSVPAFALDDEKQVELRLRLSNTVASLAEMVGLRTRLEQHDGTAIAEVLAAGPQAPGDLAQAELELLQLREAVGRLLQQLDAKGLNETAADHAPGAVAWSDAVTPPSKPPQPTPRPVVAETPAEVAAAAKTQFESDGFVADRARLGRACWRGARFQEGVSALEPLAGNAQADYWRARCLEKLGRSAEALALYRQVIALSADSPEGRSAREDSEFLQWTMLHGLVSTP